MELRKVKPGKLYEVKGHARCRCTDNGFGPKGHRLRHPMAARFLIETQPQGMEKTGKATGVLFAGPRDIIREVGE